MKKFKYQKISKTKKLRYIDNYYKKKLYIIFLPGFMSDIDGEKPKAFKKYAVKNKLICNYGECPIYERKLKQNLRKC